jgi:hypothetical protein
MSFKTLPSRKAGSNLISTQPSTRSPRSYSPGGYLVGPSHDNGGIEAIVDNEEPIEVEGGEFVMRVAAVEQYGVDFMHRLNQGLVSQEVQSMKKGGSVKNAKRPKRKLRRGMQAGIRKPAQRDRSTIRPSRPSRPSRPPRTTCSDNPQLYCPPAPPGYQGDWYANCCSELR